MDRNIVFGAKVAPNEAIPEALGEKITPATGNRGEQVTCLVAGF